ncbi:hypothetical protein [Actinocorallia sp. A-T 12471]|uniref:hypothetical protein n=1 Tax=Actinocorallia sp. A-T 12471 TaxID=3089813 RepID=UPI0029D1C0DC|nr:hypothetical protein [Actinocorallia sp. A-T 12471]MDX6739217.1 hypothetical protein [Actinocorallia sp. A-T 12471]
MGWLSETVIESAGGFLWTSGRVLEQRRFAYLFGSGTASGVLAALDAYADEEGGYAFGLDPDIRGPEGQPIAVPSALRVLEEIGQAREERLVALCDWLAERADPDGGVPAVLPSLRRYPHPPFMPVADDPRGDLLTTGQIAGPLLRHGVEHPWLRKAEAFCRTAIETLKESHPYEVGAAVAFLDGASDRAWAEGQAARLGELVREQRIVLLDPERPEEARLSPGYGPGELHMPHDYAAFPGSVARAWFSDAEMDLSLRHLQESQEADGGWPIRWVQWSSTTASEARPGVTLAALLTLRAYDAV